VDGCCGVEAHCAPVGLDYQCDLTCPPCSAATTEEACRLRTDCVADTCRGCSCSDQFVQCRSPSEPAYACPGVECAWVPDCCHRDADCSSPTSLCLAPGAFPGCGACLAGDGCLSDDDCSATGANLVCEVPACTCEGEKSCLAGCTDASCPLGESCGEDHRCRPRACDSQGDCPEFFVCSAGGTCARKPCDVDGDCEGGACVNGGCYVQAGTCTAPPA
jgi:hypothetical protein